MAAAFSVHLSLCLIQSVKREARKKGAHFKLSLTRVVKVSEEKCIHGKTW